YKSAGFRQWLERSGLRRSPDEGEIQFAWRAFQKIVEEELDYSSDGGAASEVVRQGKGQCCAFAFVYASALRANQIPARILVGRCAESARPRNNQTHVKTEFFAKGVGWVPADPAFGVFGEDEGDFLTFHIDPDLEVPTQVLGKKAVEAMQP